VSYYQEFLNKKSRRLRHGHKNREYQSVGLVHARWRIICRRYFCELPGDTFFARI
jgi:hypothetical protein